MYKYKYITLDSKGFLGSKLGDYSEIIDKHAKEGWRLVQILPISYSSHGVPTEFQIILEGKYSSMDFKK